jgi:hypothetical protein
MKRTALRLLGASALLALCSLPALADGTVWVVNNSSLTIPQTRVYKNCLVQNNAMIFGSLDPGYSQSLTRTGTSADKCMWGREVGIEPRYISCNVPFLSTNDPAVVTLEWRGTTVDDLYCVMCESGPPCP